MAKSLSVAEVLRGVYSQLGENVRSEIVFPSPIPAPIVYTDDDGECITHHVVQYRRAKVLKFAGNELAVSLGDLCPPTGFVFDESEIVIDLSAVEIKEDLGDENQYNTNLAGLLSKQHHYKSSLIGGTKDGYLGFVHGNPRSRTLDALVGKEILGAIDNPYSGGSTREFYLVKISPGEVKYAREIVCKLAEAVQMVLGLDSSELGAKRRA